MGSSWLARQLVERVVDVREATHPDEVVVLLLRAFGAPATGADLDERLAALGERGAAVALDGLRVALPLERARSWGFPLVVTTDRTHNAPGWPVVSVPALGHDEATALLRSQSDSDDPALAEIAARVDGLPLALTLLAARVRVLGAATVLAGLSARAQGAAGGLDALDQVLDQTWSQLGPLQASLAALALPDAVVDLEGAAALIGGVDRALDHVTALIATTLVRRVPGGLEIPRVVRDHVRRRAREAGLATDAGTRWVRGTLERVRAHYPSYEAWGDPTAERALLALAPAIRDATSRAEPTDALELVLALEPEVLKLGPYAPQIERIRQALPAAADPAWLSRAQRHLGELLIWVQRHEEGTEALNRAREAAHAVHRPDLESRVLTSLAWAELGSGPAARALEILDEATALARAVPETRARERLLAHACIVEGSAHLAVGNTPRRADAHHRAARLAHAAGDRAMEALALRNQGDAFAEAGDLDRARAALTDALTLARELEDRRSQSLIHGALGVVALERDDPDSALAALDHAAELARAHGDRRFEGVVTAYTGIAHLLADAPGRAAEALDRAVELDLRSDSRVALAFALAIRSAAQAALSRPEAARDDLDRARGVQLQLPNRVLDAILDLFEPVVEAARAHGLTRAGDPVAARLIWERAHAGASDGGPLAKRSYDLRLAARLQARALTTAPVASSVVVPGGGLRLAVDGSWFELDGERQPVARQPVRRMLAAFAHHHVASPGEPLSVEALFAAVWSGDHAVQSAARNRVYNAVYTLRKAGLEGWLVRRDEGWCLDPSRPIHLA